MAGLTFWCHRKRNGNLIAERNLRAPRIAVGVAEIKKTQ